MIRYLLLFLLGTGALGACSVADQEEPQALEVHVPKARFQDTRFGPQDEQAIRDVWAYTVDAQARTFIGVFELPARIPVFKSNAQLILRSGIWSDGVSTLRVNNILFTEDSLALSSIQADELTHVPTFQYHPRIATSTLSEHFEDGESLLIQDDSQVFFEVSSDSNLTVDSITGKRFGIMKAGSDLQTLAFRSAEPYAIPFNRPVFLEIHYRSSVEFLIGLKAVLRDGSVFQNYELVLRPQSKWTKVYVGLTEEVNQYIELPDTKFYISGRNRSGVKAGDFIALDNMHLLYRE